MKYNVFLSNEADTDFDEYIDYVLYTIHGKVVYIHRIVAVSMITNL